MKPLYNDEFQHLYNTKKNLLSFFIVNPTYILSKIYNYDYTCYNLFLQDELDIDCYYLENL